MFPLGRFHLFSLGLLPSLHLSIRLYWCWTSCLCRAKLLKPAHFPLSSFFVLLSAAMWSATAKAKWETFQANTRNLGQKNERPSEKEMKDGGIRAVSWIGVLYCLAQHTEAHPQQKGNRHMPTFFPSLPHTLNCCNWGNTTLTVCMQTNVFNVSFPITLHEENVKWLFISSHRLQNISKTKLTLDLT